ncbi:MAG: OmpA family protein [Pseudomonadota bacterium]
MKSPNSKNSRLLGQMMLPLLLATGAGAPAWAADVAWGTDLPGAQDHPLMRRFTGAWLVGYRQEPWAQALWPTGPGVAGWDKLKDVATLEGQVTRLVYLTPRGKGPLEVFRNHEQAFTAAGFQKQFACEADCDKLYWTWYRHTKPVDGLRWQTEGHITTESNSRYSMNSALQPTQGRFWAGRAERGGKPVHVLLYTGDAANNITGMAATYVQIVEPRPMATGQVQVADAAALQAGLSAEGRATLGGLLFDTGKAELKPDSRVQLEAMAAVLKGQPQWKVFIVGHTDNVGLLEANLALSQARAQAVVAALAAAPYGIDARRLLARGVANVAPVASNADEPGRARNRRVEMVLQ